ncbi:MAG: glycosyltransferase family 4 protein [Pseudomonadota bacterium]
MSDALFAVPGRLDLATGGYEYARRLLEALAPGKAAPALTHWPLPDLGLAPQADALRETARRLALGPVGWPVLMDGLALGVLPDDVLSAAQGPVIALVHHPLALEHGLAPADAARLFESERDALATVAAVITTSGHTADALAADYGVERRRITVARPGIPRQRVPARAGHKPAHDGPRLLSIGTLTQRKGHDVLLQALATHRALPWTLQIIGDPGRDPACAASLEALAKGLGIADRVAFSGVADRDSVTTAYATADLFVLASRHEGYGMAYAEAMAAGLPVVGCDAGAVSEATGGGACLVPPGDGAALATALGPLLESSDARAALASRGRKASAALNDWPDTAALVASALTPFLPSPPGRTHASAQSTQAHR